MSTHRTQASLITLATIGVYIGLLMAGATPQMLAQEKLEAKGSFQRNATFACPNNGLINDERDEDINPFDYDLAKRIIDLYHATQVRLEITKFEQPELLGNYSFFFEHIDFAPYLNSKGKLIEDDWKSDSSQWASASHAGQIVELNSLFLTPLADCTKASKQKFPLASSRLEIDANELRLELTVAKASESRATEAAKSIRALFERRRVDTENRAINSVCESTEVRSKKNKLILVTRLPRAHLDALLATDAK